MQDKKPTIQDVAKTAGVSVATVSRVINHNINVNPNTANKVQKVISELGYSTAKYKSAIKNGIILVIVPQINNFFFNTVINGIMDAAIGHNYNIYISQPPESISKLEDYLDLVKPINPTGVILLGDIIRSKDIDLLHKLFFIYPTFLCCWNIDSSKISYVNIDNKEEVKKITEYLISKNHKRIALFCVNHIYPTVQQRKSGYFEALKLHNIPVDDNLIFSGNELSDLLNFDTAYSIATKVLNSSVQFDSIVCLNEMGAAAIIKAANKFNINIPGDIAVTGFDNTNFSMITTPGLTTVNMPQYQLGHIALEQLAERIDNPTLECKQIILDSDIIIREST
jgi:DNA-binding LacI/PurR family transcriptional regulator